MNTPNEIEFEKELQERGRYRQIKEIEPDIYEVLNADDNHKTIKK